MNVTHLDGHLTDEQFIGLLLGDVPSAVASHIESCAQCKEEAAQVSSAIGSFEFESRLWAEQRAASRPPMHQVDQPAWSWLRPATWAAAAAIVVAAGLSVAHQGRPSSDEHAAMVNSAVVVTAQPPPAVAQDTLQADNQLLSAIDGELRGSDPSPSSVYGLKIDARTPHSKVGRGITN